MGRRTAATGVWLPPGGCSHRGAPPILFLFLTKRECAAPGGREKIAWTRSGAVALRADGSRRIGASADFALPSGTLNSSAIPVTAVPWRMVPALSGWLSHCLCFSFRCRWPGGQREPVQRADEGIGPYGDAEDVGGHGPFAGMRKVIRFPGMRKAIAFCANGEGRSFFRGMWKGIGLLRGY